MQRRQFIRIAGGGVIFAATAALLGCAYVPPPEAIAPWRGPGDESDVRRWVLRYAILAPHSHNLQSWLVDLSRPDEIILRCDRKRLLPEIDPFSRQIMMSHGTFLELLDIAARERGLRAAITLFPEGEYDAQGIDDRPVAHIRLVPDAAVRKDPLFTDTLTRRTNRSRYELGRPVPAAAWQAMAATSYGVAMQPISQALQEYPEQAGPCAGIHRLLAAPQPVHTVQMLARVGYAPAVPAAPRRGLDAHVVRA